MSDFKHSEVSFKYYLPDNQDEFILHANAKKMFHVLLEIDTYCRSIIKYSVDETLSAEQIAEKIRDLIHNEIDLNMVP